MRLAWTSGEGEPVSAALPLGLASRYVGHEAPASMDAAGTREVSVTMKNNGVIPWPVAGVRLAPTADVEAWGGPSVPLPSDVASGATVRIDFTITAPLASGSYRFQWRLRTDDGPFGEASAPATIAVVAPVPPECTELRARAAALVRSTSVLPRAVSRAKADLRGAALGEKAELLAEIRELKSSLRRATEEREAVFARIRELGCP